MRPHDPETVYAVWTALHQGMPQKQVAAQFGVSLGSVSNINCGRRHPEITSIPAFNATLISLAFTGAA